MTLEVIGTGFGRTGTDSMKEALNLLGFGPCHHMKELMAHDEQKNLWRALVAGGEADWEALLGGYRSCVDWPSAHYWPELISRFPDAKVILTYRDPESWWQSYEKTIMRVISKPGDDASVGQVLLRTKVFSGDPTDKKTVLAAYNANVEKVKAEVPPERLLIHNLGDGWRPLCKHLRVPVPDKPYPRGNSTAEFQQATMQRDIEPSPNKPVS